MPAPSVIVRNNFSIFDGTVIIAVPLVVESDDYSIIRTYLSLLSPESVADSHAYLPWQ